MEKRNILHITPHLGGGVGRVLLNYLSKVKNDPCRFHQVACLDYANEESLKIAKLLNIVLNDRMCRHHHDLLALITRADIILIHWWNHPLLYDFLVRMKLPPCRVVMWSHISGFNPPYVFTSKIFKYPDLFVFTTPVSYETKEVINLPDENKKRLRVVWSTGGVEHVKNLVPQAHIGFNIGYIGTVDYCKLHPCFLKLCSQINIPNARFIVCGGPKEHEIKKESEGLGIIDKFVFTGLVSDIREYLAIFDVFGYPLAPYHYGTCDQVIAESMAAGVVPVVLSNRMENHMVENRVTGIVANNQQEYVSAIKELFANSELRKNLSINAQSFAHRTFSLEKIEHEWNIIFEELLAFPKIERRWQISKPADAISATDVFLESLGEYGQVFLSYCTADNEKALIDVTNKIKRLGELPLWQASTRGTVHHYANFFSADKMLGRWSKLMRNWTPNDAIKNGVCTDD